MAAVRTTALGHGAWQALFLAVLPAIHKCVLFAFRRLSQEEQEEVVQEALANACVAFARLADQGRSERAFPTSLARFAVAQVRAGRKVGTPFNGRDVLSPSAQRQKQFLVERLDRFDVHEGQWHNSVVEDHRTPVPDQVWFRIDFPRWLEALSWRDRRIAQALAAGYSSGEIAGQFALSPGRVSQLRRAFHHSWLVFHGEIEPARSAACITAA